jgi:hypothetical protein
MKKLLLLGMALFIVSAVSAQKTFYYPGTGTPIIKIQIPTDVWAVSNDESSLSFSPTDDTDTGRMISMIWKSENPGAEDAVTALVNESFELVETLLTDLTWDEETSEFDINGIAFVAIDGWGNYTNEDGTKDEMMSTIMIFFPDDDNMLTFVYIGLEEAYSKHKESFLTIIQSIEPY